MPVIYFMAHILSFVNITGLIFWRALEGQGLNTLNGMEQGHLKAAISCEGCEVEKDSWLALK